MAGIKVKCSVFSVGLSELSTRVFCHIH